MTKNIPLFTFVFAAYVATNKYSTGQYGFLKRLDSLCSDNVHVLSDVRRKLKNAPYLLSREKLVRLNNFIKVAVLIVENDPLFRLSIVQMAERENFEVLSAGNASEAISILNSRPDIRIVYTEIAMPGSIDGMELARTIRKSWPRIEIILTSGRRIVSTFDLPGKCVFIRKPFETQRIVAIFRGLTKDG